MIYYLCFGSTGAIEENVVSFVSEKESRPRAIPSLQKENSNKADEMSQVSVSDSGLRISRGALVKSASDRGLNATT